MVTVVCTGGEAPPSALSLSWLDSAHRVIAADAGLRFLKAVGRRADLWIGDGDSLPLPLEDWVAWYDQVQLLPREKDETDTEVAVRLAVEAGADEVWLIGGGGGRMDHWWSNVRLMATSPRLTRWLTAWEEAWTLGKGGAVHVPRGTVSVFPLGRGPWKAASQGLHWPLPQVDFSEWHSLSNEAAEKGAVIESLEGRFLVVRPLAEGSPR